MGKQVLQVEEKRGLTFLRNMTGAAGLGALVLSGTANAAALTATDISGPVTANGDLVGAAILAVLGIVLIIWGGKKVIGFFGR